MPPKPESNMCQWHQHPSNPTQTGCVRHATGNQLCGFHRAIAAGRAHSSPKKRFVVQHEKDQLPIYVIDHDLDDAVVEFSPQLPWQLRQRLARLIAQELEQADPKLGEDIERVKALSA